MTKQGFACGTDPTVGCYGFASYAHTTYFTCASPAAGTGNLVHRSPVPTTALYANSCMSGYHVGELYDSDAGMQLDCFAYCLPGESSSANVGGGFPNGVAPLEQRRRARQLQRRHPHRREPGVERRALLVLVVLRDRHGERVAPLADQRHARLLHRSHEVCWDANHDGMRDAGDAVDPPCATLPVHGTTTTLGAADLGCVDSATAGLTSAFTAPALIARRLRLGLQLPEFPALPLSPR